MSKFVSAGTNEDPPERDDEWLKAQQDLDENRRRREAENRQQDGKTLYEVLQANKAAKQEAFEESIRLKNQFRSLDDDEVDFLDSVLESTRAKEAAVRKETTEQLEIFRRQQEEAEKAARAESNNDSIPQEEELWHVGTRKRKKGKEKENLIGVKLRRVSSTATEKATHSPSEVPAVPETTSVNEGVKKGPLLTQSKDMASGLVQARKPPGLVQQQMGKNPGPSSKASPTIGLGLGAYASDED